MKFILSEKTELSCKNMLNISKVSPKFIESSFHPLKTTERIRFKYFSVIAKSSESFWSETNRQPGVTILFSLIFWIAKVYRLRTNNLNHDFGRNTAGINNQFVPGAIY